MDAINASWMENWRGAGCTGTAGRTGDVDCAVVAALAGAALDFFPALVVVVVVGAPVGSTATAAGLPRSLMGESATSRLLRLRGAPVPVLLAVLAPILVLVFVLSG